MASALRSSILRQCLGAPVQRTASATLPAFRSQQWALQRAAFQTSARMAILPPLPQAIQGTVNDPVKVPHAHPSHGSYHWTAERLVSVGLIPITILPFAVGSLNPLLDGTLISLIIVHTYIGFQSCITDYLPNWRVPILRKVFDWANVLAVFVVGWGWYEFETNDVGITEAIKRVWTAKKTVAAQ
ncbi:succinate dehydrogenase flavo protein subunit [Dissoconium aciculare CBS 342.82]|uniref:Succinate dehydrogenase [ubiquinone] cytochrome b small subunit n=1 Tax=Dissoconium aciculare CBS 342.82 TaxID=1314786 RepID=A0A6J3MBS7_9PEZI|nr:succinate dehydrogenase flavo protein subunit [Dissoconium aciculare CBS 342.82]KAF1825476.1 succinate dehydrogenase flavo protein subunit [Dissoconium aciculare CBS 342.82]